MKARATRIFAQNVLRHFSGSTTLTGKQTFLSDAYRCQDIWDAQKDSLPMLKDLNMDKFYLAIDKNFQTKGKVLPIDVDIFAMGARSDQQLDDLQDVLHRFRRSPLAADALPSTSHAAVRAFLMAGSTQRKERLLDMLDDRINYGLFLDEHTASWLMDELLAEGNNTDAARVATQLMLQEEWEEPISRALALYACCSHVQSPTPERWQQQQEPPDDPNAETEFVRVKYLRNEWNDGHFDLREPSQLVGKTLAWLGSAGGQQGGPSCQLLGWALSGDWRRLRRYCDAPPAEPVSRDAVDGALRLVEAAGDGAESEELSERLSRLPAAEEPLLETLRQAVLSAVDAHQTTSADRLRLTYDSWQQRRRQELELQQQAADRRRQIQQLDERRQQLRERQLLLGFFDAEERLRAEADRQWGQPPPVKPARIMRLRRRRRAAEDQYVPPDVRREHST